MITRGASFVRFVASSVPEAGGKETFGFEDSVRRAMSFVGWAKFSRAQSSRLGKMEKRLEKIERSI